MDTVDSPNQLMNPRIALPEVVRKHPLVFFFAMSYVFSWAVSIPYVLSAWCMLPGNYTALFILKPFVGPTLAASIMTNFQAASWRRTAPVVNDERRRPGLCSP